MDIHILFYKVYQGNVTSKDYIDWALSMLNTECSSLSLNILSSLREPINIFEVEDYFRRALSELGMQEPDYEECAAYYIRHLSKKILEDEESAIDSAYEIYEVIRDLEEAEGLEEWYEISEIIDDYRYGDNPTNISKTALMFTIEKVAKKQLKKYSK